MALESWLLQSPLLSGEGAVEAYLPSKKIAIAVAVTFDPAAFDSAAGTVCVETTVKPHTCAARPRLRRCVQELTVRDGAGGLRPGGLVLTHRRECHRNRAVDLGCAFTMGRRGQATSVNIEHLNASHRPVRHSEPFPGCEVSRLTALDSCLLTG